MLTETTKKSKREIYADFGVDYDPKNGKILAPVFGWIPTLLIDGNSKIGKGVYHFSTLPTNKPFSVNIGGVDYVVIGTCPCHCEGCYATKGKYNCNNVIESLAIKTYLSRNHVDFVRRAILAQIIADGVKIVRIHASGDFFSDAYIAMWREIVSKNPAALFWTYTKNEKAEKAFDAFGNANIVKSLVPGCGLNFGHCDYILNTYNALKSRQESVYICRCGIDKDQHCTNCHGCALNKYVLFIEHSTDYNAKKDPCYNDLKAVIESQPRP